MSTPERRQNPRFACDLEAKIEVDGSEPIKARTQDISFSGICLVSDAPISPGVMATVSVQLIMEGFHSDALPLAAQIVWCTKLPDGHQVGARFDPSMEDDRWAKLDVLIRFLTGELSVDPGGEPAG